MAATQPARPAGMKQRVSIVLALGHQPDLLVLDEPVAALDPVGRREFIQLLLDLHLNEGRTVLFSTHITSDVERVAADVALLQDGKVALHCNLEDLKERFCRAHVHTESFSTFASGSSSKRSTSWSTNCVSHRS